MPHEIGSPDTGRRGTSIDRAVLAVLVAGSAVVGLWALADPASFYRDFPGDGRGWVSVDGAFNEHLLRDVGGLNLALAVLGTVAAWTLSATMIRVASVAWLVYSIPHLVYHLHHLQGLEPGDQVAMVVSLSITVVLPVLLLVRSYWPVVAPRSPGVPASDGVSTPSTR